MSHAATRVRQSDRDAAIILAGKVTAIKFASIPDYDPYVQALALHREAETLDLILALEGAIGALEQDLEAGKDSGDSDWEGLAYQRLEAARAAIARATGAGA